VQVAKIRDWPTDASVDDPDLVEGAPCSIQVMGRNMKDEDLLANAQIIEDVLKA
jgi:Asp-tRNA(Asn)/Glu-tRNA(Gln) amidotransferase A subunit family amidase